MDTTPTGSSPTRTPEAPSRLLCAYSPTWLSGPTPGYEGLCPSWDGDTDAEVDRSGVHREHSLV